MDYLYAIIPIALLTIMVVGAFVFLPKKKKTHNGMECPYNDFPCTKVVDVYLDIKCSECPNYNNGIRLSKGMLFFSLFKSKK